jgi:predicted RNase H-like HicB family nuclease
MKKMKTTALIEKSSDGTFGIFTPDINHTIIGDGNTVEDAKNDFENSVNEMILSYTERGMQIPDELQNIEFEYKYDVSSIFNEIDCINISKFAKRIGINANLLRQYKMGNTYISDTQKMKIEKGLHNLGKQLLTLSL